MPGLQPHLSWCIHACPTIQKLTEIYNQSVKIVLKQIYLNAD
nr:MAG TPA: 4Fe-4S dicluster domain protein [Microviridae sp.]